MKQINIKRDGTGKVTFDTVSIDTTENVFFTNLDPKSEHWPAFPPQPPSTQYQPFTQNKLGASPSPNSSQCIVPPPSNLTPPSNQVIYGCQVQGHGAEKGIINVFAPLAAADDTTLTPATKGKAIASQQVVTGGMSPYVISGQQFQVTDSNGKVIQSGSGIGPGLKLNASTNSNGISVSGTPTISGTYNFTFNVDDAMGRNLQQTQYEMVVA
jgi:hypothetical protein